MDISDTYHTTPYPTHPNQSQLQTILRESALDFETDKCRVGRGGPYLPTPPTRTHTHPIVLDFVGINFIYI